MHEHIMSYLRKQTADASELLAHGYIVSYLRRQTVDASELLAHGHIVSARKPLLSKTVRNESQDVNDPVRYGTESTFTYNYSSL